MDWAAIASILAERSDRPIFLLDKRGRIRIFNHGMEQILGWRRFHVEGQLWAKTCTPSEFYDEAERWIEEALRGALRSYITIGLTNLAERISLHLEFSLVGRGPIQGLLTTVIEATPFRAPSGGPEGQDIDYEVHNTGIEFGRLLAIAGHGQSKQYAHEDARCFAVIHNNQAPCENCPLLDEGAPYPRTTVQYRATGGRRAFEIKTAEDLGDGRARVRLRLVPEEVLNAIHAVKVDDLAQRANLSPREREVLSYLLLGRTVDDIARALGIAVRTVKYHQASVLEKLGADSRADLMRLLF